MSAELHTPERLLDFLRQASTQGVLNPAVAKSRALAVEQVFSELNASERLDIRLIDVDLVCARLHKIEGSSIRPEVVELYKQRVRAALQDYFAWLADSKRFVSVGGDPVRRDRRILGGGEAAAETRALEETALAGSDRRPDLISIPLREGVTVYITQLPLDLSPTEAAKIARVVEALALPSEGEHAR